MKRKHVSLLLALTLILSTLVLASCSEAEPLPEGVSALPDLDASELTASLADESGVIQWPAELLPEGFPVPKYEEIYSVSREDNELTIILLSKREYSSNSPETDIEQTLYNQGYVFYVPESSSYRTMPAVNRDGWRVQLETSRDSERLKPLAERYGYAYEINVRQIVSDLPESLFWKYPAPSTDLGYERKTFNEWPADLLPSDVPIPDPETIVSMEVRPNGVFITLKEYLTSNNKYEQMLAEAGYYHMAIQPHRDKDGNYYYEEYGSFGNDDYMITTFQFCRYNEHIEK